MLQVCGLDAGLQSGFETGAKLGNFRQNSGKIGQNLVSCTCTNRISGTRWVGLGCRFFAATLARGLLSAHAFLVSPKKTVEFIPAQLRSVPPTRALRRKQLDLVTEGRRICMPLSGSWESNSFGRRILPTSVCSVAMRQGAFFWRTFADFGALPRTYLYKFVHFAFIASTQLVLSRVVLRVPRISNTYC